jgi:hypothetical protein
MSRTLISILICFNILSNFVNAQKLTQTIRGRVIDKQSQISLPGANVIIPGSNPLIGTTSDELGYFIIKDVPIGRINLLVSFMGYNTKTLNNLNLSSGKELNVNIEIEEEVKNVKEVVINANSDKTVPINKMASISARTFSVEESERYAGARNDVSRMATNYAGVSTANDAVNDIVIRGNTPNGLLWRLEGVDIPNPNHFGGMGAAGGPVSMLNNNVLSNSDFMTSAFPSEYGDAISGVFDLKMRSGNYEKHEFLAQIGVGGFEFGIEGPVSKINHSSYLINYRYSTLGLMSGLEMDFGTGSAIPKYQDLSFKLNMPTKRSGTFSVFGLGGINSIEFIKSKEDTTSNKENFYVDENIDIYSRNKMGVIGINYTYIINPATYFKITMAGSAIKNSGEIDSVSTNNREPIPYIRQNLVNTNIFTSAFFNKKFSAHNNLRIGFTGKQIAFNLLDSSFSASLNRFRTDIEGNGSTYLLQPYIEWQYKITDEVVFNSGVTFQHLVLNGYSSVEPRLGFKWNFTPGQSLSLGYGLHSKMVPIFIYFKKVRLADGSYIMPDKDLGFIKAQHFVAGYDWNITETLRLKTEVYFQDIFSAIVDVNPDNFTILNSNSFNFQPPDTMKNGGRGRNYGIELTFEKFLQNGFYGLLTTSLFKSECSGSNGNMRPSAFDGGYVINLLAGKDFNLKSKKQSPRFKKVIAFDGRVCAAGGQRYTPVDMAKSLAQKQTVYSDEFAYSKKFNDYFRADIRIALRLDGAKASQEFAFDIQNVTNQKNPLYMRYNLKKGTEDPVYQLGLFPMMQYKISF